MSPSWFSSNRLTPPPDGRRTGVVRVDDRVSERTQRSWARENKRDIFEAIDRKGEQPCIAEMDEKLTIDGVVLPEHYCLRSHQARIDQDPPAPSDPGWRQGPVLSLDSTKPYVLVDYNGVVAAWVFPSFLKENSRIYLDEITTTLAEHEFPKSERDKGLIHGAKTNGKACGGRDTYTTTHGIAGTATYVEAWHQQCHQLTRAYAPSKDLILARTISQSVQRDYFFCSWRDIHARINHLLSLVHPEFHWILSNLRTSLTQHPSCLKFLSIWESIFPGHSVICNRTSGEHLDKNGVRRGFEVLLAHGKFSGGELYLKDINVQIAFLPGTLVLLDGTAQRHKIQPWPGSQRFSNALFVHRSVLDEHDIPHTLPDVTIHNIRARIGRTTGISPTPNSPLTVEPPITHTKKHGRDDAEEPKALRSPRARCW